MSDERSHSAWQPVPAGAAPFESEEHHHRRAARRRVLIVAGIVAAAALTVLTIAVMFGAGSGGTPRLLVGALDSSGLAALSVAAFLTAGTAALFTVPVDGWRVFLMMPVWIAAILATLVAMLGAALLADKSVTALRLDGCETGYVVVEQSFLLSGLGDVYQQDGIVVTRVEAAGADDGYRPFADGAYIAERAGDTIRVWYSFHSEARFVSTDGEPAFTLPVREGHGC